MKKPKKGELNYKPILKKIYEGDENEETLTSIIEKKSTWKEIEFLKRLPVFEVKLTQELPLEETIIPIVKRKLLTYVFSAHKV
jgi:hypothetical protein